MKVVRVLQMKCEKFKFSPESLIRPCYQIAAVADGLLCGLVGKIVARLEENSKWLWVDDFDRAGVGCGLA